MNTLLSVRFWSKAKPEGECLIWQGALSDGYGSFWDGEKLVAAHRYAYMLSNGSIPEDQEIDHLCRNRACVKPSHLEAVTTIVNVQRSVPFKKKWKPRGYQTHCSVGHEMTNDNIVQLFAGPRGRVCKICWES